MNRYRASGVAVVLVGGLVALAACSSSSAGTGSTSATSFTPAAAASSAPTSSAPTSSAPTSSAPTSSSSSVPATGGAISAAQARALAKAGDLTTVDFPGYSYAVGTDNQTDSSDAQVAACLGVALPSYVYNDPGADFTKGNLEVDSTTDTVTSAAAVTATIAAFGGAKAQGCFDKLLARALTAEGATAPDLTLKQIPISIKGAAGAFGVEISGKFTVRGQSGQLTALEFGAGVGQCEVGIDLTDVGTTAAVGVPTAQLTALLQTSVDRVSAAYPH